MVSSYLSVARGNETKGMASFPSERTNPGMANSSAIAVDLIRSTVDGIRSGLHRVQMAAEKSGREANETRVVAVTRHRPLVVIGKLYEAGHRCFGETVVEDILCKACQLPQDIEWHFCGKLRRMEVVRLLNGVPNLAMVESVDNKKIAHRLNHAVTKFGCRKPLKVLVQVNTSGDESKFGVDPSGCVELAKYVSLRCPNLEFCGLVTIAMLDYTSPQENFETLENCRMEVCKALTIPEEQCELSMGMSTDFEKAIELGCTNLRIESTIFGGREFPQWFLREFPQESTRAEESNPDLIPMIVENSAARSDIHVIDETNNSSRKRRKFLFPYTAPITFLDPWNRIGCNKDEFMYKAEAVEKAAIEGTNIRGLNKEMTKIVINFFKTTMLDAGILREKHPDYIPVTLEKDASSDIPDIDMKKYHVPGLMPLGEFVHAIIRPRTRLSRERLIFVYVKNTVPPTGAVMSAIDEENKDEDGYLHITYSGEGNAPGSINHEQEWLAQGNSNRSGSLIRPPV